MGLTDSETGVTYELLLNGNSTGISTSGNGSAISFGNQTVEANYTVRARQLNTLCPDTDMTGSVNVALLPLTTVSITPASQVICETGTVSVTGTASTASTQSVTYQWYKDGVSLGSSQQNRILTLTAVLPTQSGNYSLVATGTCNSATSSAFSLTVNPLPTVTIVFNNSAMVMGTGIPTITVPATPGQQFQVLGGNSFEFRLIIDRINGYEIRQRDINATGVFIINRVGPFSLTVIGSNGCSRTVQGILVNP